MKKRAFLFLSIALSLVFFASCGNGYKTGPSVDALSQPAPTAFSLDSMKQIIEAKDKIFAKAFVSGDSATLVNAYTTDARLFPPNAGVVSGQAALASLISQYLKYGIKEFQDSTTAVYGNEEYVVEEGNLFMGDAMGNTIDKGKYVVVWKNEKGDWKIYSDIWNTSLPPAAVKK
jgi:ketosteroid isomerase-like protein